MFVVCQVRRGVLESRCLHLTAQAALALLCAVVVTHAIIAPLQRGCRWIMGVCERTCRTSQIPHPACGPAGSVCRLSVYTLPAAWKHERRPASTAARADRPQSKFVFYAALVLSQQREHWRGCAGSTWSQQQSTRRLGRILELQQYQRTCSQLSEAISPRVVTCCVCNSTSGSSMPRQNLQPLVD